MRSSEAIQGLEDLAALVTSNTTKITDGEAVRLNAVIQEVKRCVGLCLPCRGRGVIYLTNKNRPGMYKTRELKGGGLLYEYECWHCAAKGQLITAKCNSCLKPFDTHVRVRPTQVEMIFMDNMCDVCFEARDKNVGLVSLDQPKEEAKKLEPAKNENPEPLKKKGKK
jgi:hypothetical protein